MAKLSIQTKNNRKLLKKMFTNMGLDSFLDGFSEFINTNKGDFFLSSIEYGKHSISNKVSFSKENKEKLELIFTGDEDSIREMVLKISDFFDNHDVAIKEDEE